MLPERQMLSIVLGTFNRMDDLMQLMSDISKYAIDSHEVIIVDGGSNQESINYLSQITKENVTIILDKNRDKDGNMKRSLQECYNMGFKIATGRYIVHLNDDCRLEDQETPWPQKAIDFIEKPGNEEIGLLSLQLGEPDEEGNIKYRFSYDDILGSNLMFANHGLINRKTFERLGWWDEGFQFYAADNDFALTIRDNQMHVVGFEETDRVIHTATPDQTRNINEQMAVSDFARLKEKWQTKIGTIVQQEMQKQGRFRSLKQTEIQPQVQVIKPE